MDSFIKNIEILDLLDDYLPCKKRMSITNTDDKYNIIDEYIVFYKRLSQFQVPLHYEDLLQVSRYSNNIEGKPFYTVSSVFVNYLESLKVADKKNIRELFLKIICNK